jgi:TatA/E family protein of Tat protein translocase
MGNLGWTEILIILGVALIIFGPRKLPQLGKSLGESLAQFRRASEDFKRTWEQEVETEQRRLEPASVTTADTASNESDSTIHSEAYGEQTPSDPIEQPAPVTDEPEEVAATEPRQDWIAR